MNYWMTLKNYSLKFYHQNNPLNHLVNKEEGNDYNIVELGENHLKQQSFIQFFIFDAHSLNTLEFII